MSDWLGNGNRPPDDWRPFDKARAFVRSLGLEFSADWKTYCRSGKKPDDIPVKASTVYADAGWAGTSDWLGNGVRRGGWRPFEDARAFVRSLGLEFGVDWKTYCRSGKKPDDIPLTPNIVYANVGWTSWADWLGNGRRVGGWRRFDKARAFVRSLGFESSEAWKTYCRSAKKPHDIPVAPNIVYSNTGWDSWADWLGNGRRIGNWRRFDKARAFVRSLGLRVSRQLGNLLPLGEKAR